MLLQMFKFSNVENRAWIDSFVVDVTVQIWRGCGAELQGLYALVWRSVICDAYQKQYFSVLDSKLRLCSFVSSRIIVSRSDNSFSLPTTWICNKTITRIENFIIRLRTIIYWPDGWSFFGQLFFLSRLHLRTSGRHFFFHCWQIFSSTPSFLLANKQSDQKLTQKPVKHKSPHGSSRLPQISTRVLQCNRHGKMKWFDTKTLYAVVPIYRNVVRVYLNQHQIVRFLIMYLVYYLQLRLIA